MISGTDALIAAIDKNRRTQIRVTMRDIKGVRVADVRMFERNGLGQSLPTTRGFSVRPDLLRGLIDGLTKAEEAAIADGLIVRVDNDLGRRAAAIASRYGD